MGAHYGTWLGAEYAHLFPKKVGRTVLDGAVNTELNPIHPRLGVRHHDAPAL
ncbi:hypothetical protein [Streptomyces sp. HUAS TT20]|uniref:hypothetical protein n=1 Tax=Streptomyces sp. HUAS TT20 TaxID=3447509 RepID=UPI0021DB3816|nr:hypothetical protein [Streptomyces sp. HUAS 15-9]UXY32159.1 hypothetical protein N8I87_40280 [Streptomyces sp. HUAS 15-9]